MYLSLTSQSGAVASRRALASVSTHNLTGLATLAGDLICSRRGADGAATPAAMDEGYSSVLATRKPAAAWRKAVRLWARVLGTRNAGWLSQEPPCSQRRPQSPSTQRDVHSTTFPSRSERPKSLGP